MTRLIPIIFLSMLIVTPAFGQEKFLQRAQKILPTSKYWSELQAQFNSIPINRLEIIEKELDSTISTTDCYKFIHNSDTTKFVAFFVMRKDNPKFDRLVHFGRTVHKNYRPSVNDSILYLGYILLGMKFEQNWYYTKKYEYEFWDGSDDLAKNDYLFSILDDIKYLNNPEKFWDKGGSTNIFRILPPFNSYLNEYTGLPEIVGWHNIFYIRRQNDLLNEQTEMTACTIEDKIWNLLREEDSLRFHSRYKSRYSSKSCLVLYNSDRSKVLLPILYYDSKSKPWLTYYFLKISSSNTALYKWLKFPTKTINRKPDDESLEIIYDIRTFIKNWGWGTVNMISSKSFWNDNFTDNDLQTIIIE